MIRSKNTLMHFQNESCIPQLNTLMHFQNESYIPQLFAGKFSPRQPKCLNGVAVGDWDGPFQNESYIY